MPLSDKYTEGWKLTAEQQDLLERFLTAYNSIDRFLRKQLQTNRGPSFASLIRDYERLLGLGAEGDYLRTAAALRNVLVHDRTNPHLHLAIPTPPVVYKLEEILRELTNPPKVIPRFQKQVETLTPEISLAEVLRQIAKRDYSLFPVYDGTKFRGLLTENGITRWLARHVTKELSLIDLDEVAVKRVLREEEKRQNWLFVKRSCTIGEVKAAFRDGKMLEAVLITHNGVKTERLLGIITRWDILHED